MRRENADLSAVEQPGQPIGTPLAGIGSRPRRMRGICVERRPGHGDRFLGILKAGGAYVPLDPAYPMDRVSFMLADSKMTVLAN